ncbi:MAG: hypothetical protein V7717_05285 [Porticoccaceae bacterium]
MATQSINVNINLNGLHGELQSSLQRIICLVATGLEANSDVDPNEIALPTNIKSSFSNLDLNKENFHIQYTEWILSNGFRDAIESVSSFLESAHRVLAIWDLIEKQNSGAPIKGDEWNQIFQDVGNKFHRLGLPDKLEHISKEHGIEVTDSYKEQILSINVARNCYVHRNGIVSDRDINEENTLKVKWSRLHTFLQNEDGEKELVPGMLVEKESTVCVRFDENEKAFSLNEQLSFTVEEMSEILWCLFLFGNDLIMKISKFGEEKGFIQPSEAKSA